MKKIIFSILTLLLIISCALESKFGLPNDEKVNKNLIDVWYLFDNKKDSLIINKKTDFIYEIILSDEKEIIQGYTKEIKGFTIMNLIVDGAKGKKINVFLWSKNKK